MDRGCDLWSLGIIANQLVTGKYLFNYQFEFHTFEAIKSAKFALNPMIP